MVTKRRGRLPWIERHGTGWRGWWIDDAGLRRRGQTRPTERQAYDDAALARRRAPTRMSGLTIGGAIALLERDLDARERSAGTKSWAACQKRTLLRYYAADAPLDSLTVTELQAWFDLRRKSVSASTLQHHLRFLRRVFGCAVRAGWQGDVPLRRLVLPAVPEHRPSVFSWEEAIDLMEKVRVAEGRPRLATGGNDRDADLLELLLRTGLRRSELARLRRQDIDLRAKVLRVAGKRGPRVVPLSDQAVKCCERLCGRSLEEGLFADVTPDHISRIFRRWRVRLAEPRLHPHAFRHTLATEMVRRGTPLATVARILGHAPGSFHITLRYYSASEPSLREAIESL